MPIVAMAAAGTAAVSDVLLTNVVESGVLPSVTVAPERNPEPVRLRVNAGPPTVTVEGLIAVRLGMGAASTLKG